MTPDDLRTVGVIVGAHGLQGTFKLDAAVRFSGAVRSVAHGLSAARRDGAGRVPREERALGELGRADDAEGDHARAKPREELRGAELCVAEAERWGLPEDVLLHLRFAGFHGNRRTTARCWER